MVVRWLMLVGGRHEQGTKGGSSTVADVKRRRGSGACMCRFVVVVQGRRTGGEEAVGVVMLRDRCGIKRRMVTVFNGGDGGAANSGQSRWRKGRVA